MVKLGEELRAARGRKVWIRLFGYRHTVMPPPPAFLRQARERKPFTRCAGASTRHRELFTRFTEAPEVRGSARRDMRFHIASH